MALFVLLPFAVLTHEPRGCISDDLDPITVVRNFLRSGLPHIGTTPQFVKQGQIRGPDGKTNFCVQNVGMSLLGMPGFLIGQAVERVVPFPWPALRLRWTDWPSFLFRMSFAAVLPVVFLVYYAVAFSLCRSRTRSLLYAVGVVFGTQILLLTKNNYSNCLNAIGVGVAYLGFVRYVSGNRRSDLVVCGAGLAIAIVSRQVSYMYLPVFCAFLFPAMWKRAHIVSGTLATGLPVIAGVTLNFYYNYIRFGEVLCTGYPTTELITCPVYKGVFPYLFAIDESLLFNSPILLLGLATIRRCSFKDSRMLLAGATGLLHLGFYCCIGYIGGLVGTRYMSEVLFLLLLPVVFVSERRAVVWLVVLIVYGAANNGLHMLCDNYHFGITGGVRNASIYAMRDPVAYAMRRMPADFVFPLALQQAWVLGNPALFVSLVWGRTGLLLMLGYLAAAVAAACCFLRRNWTVALVCALVPFLCAMITAMAAVCRYENPRTRNRVECGGLTLSNMAAQWKRNEFIVSAQASTDRRLPHIDLVVTMTRSAFPSFSHTLKMPVRFDPLYADTTRLKPGETLDMRRKVVLSPYLPPGNYALTVVLAEAGCAETTLGEVFLRNRPASLHSSASINARDLLGSFSRPGAGAAEIRQSEKVAFSVTVPPYPLDQLDIIPQLFSSQTAISGVISLKTQSGSQTTTQTLPVRTQGEEASPRFTIAQRSGVLSCEITVRLDSPESSLYLTDIVLHPHLPPPLHLATGSYD